MIDLQHATVDLLKASAKYDNDGTYNLDAVKAFLLLMTTQSKGTAGFRASSILKRLL